MAADSSRDIYPHKFMSPTHRKPSNQHMSSIHMFIGILFIGVYGLVCYQIGVSSRSVELWDQLETPVLYHKELTHPQMRVKVDESLLPYKCGVVFFYHIPSTGGSTINQWLLNFTPQYGGNVKYFTHWGGHNSIGGGARIQDAFVSGNNGGMNAFVQNLEADEWRISHCHHNSLNLNESEHLLDLWRLEVESQGCQFVANVMFRESLSHTLSLYKHLRRYNSTREEWTSHLMTQSELGHWATELDFFLYNNIVRNPHGVPKEEKVRRALELLEKHFDLATVGDHARYKETILKITGWTDIDMPRQNTHKGELMFTKKEVEQLHKLLTANGDTDFIDQVKKIYDV